MRNRNFQLTVSIVVTVLSLAVGAYYLVNRQSEPAEDTNLSILVIGNSFTYQNNLDKMIGELMQAQTRQEAVQYKYKGIGWLNKREKSILIAEQEKIALEKQMVDLEHKALRMQMPEQH